MAGTGLVTLARTLTQGAGCHLTDLSPIKNRSLGLGMQHHERQHETGNERGLEHPSLQWVKGETRG